MYQPKTITSKELIPDGEYFVYGANGIIGKYSSFNHESPQLVIGCRGSVGSVHMTKPKSWITGNAMVVNPRNNDISIRFLEYFFRGAVDLSKAITGTAQPQITRTSLSPIIFRYPSPLIQQKIVAKLDAIFVEIDKAMAAAEANAKNAEVLFQCYLTQVFEGAGEGFKTLALCDVCSLDKNQGIHKNLPYIGLENIESNTAQFIQSINLLTEVKSSTFKFTEEHLLYGRLRPYLNKVFLPNFIGHCSTEIFPIKPKKIISREFLKYWFMREKNVNEINATCTGARMPRANMNAVMNFPILLPPIAQQNKIINNFNLFYAKTNKLKNLYKVKTDNLIFLKNSILKQAFNGELVKAA
jgi:type I restriction enzyme S subunit